MEGDSANVLCLEEFQAFFRTYCTVCPWDNASRMLNFFDTDKDGCLSLEEFLELYKHINDETIPDDGEVDDEAQQAFDNWTEAQTIPETEFNCYLDIHTEWENGYNFFAGHDCETYDLVLSVMAKKNDWSEHRKLMNSGADLVEDCEDIGVFDRLCKFKLTPENNKLGI